MFMLNNVFACRAVIRAPDNVRMQVRMPEYQRVRYDKGGADKHNEQCRKIICRQRFFQQDERQKGTDKRRCRIARACLRCAQAVLRPHIKKDA